MRKTIFTLMLIISVLYIISPLDMLPDFIPILGWADDMGAVIVAILSFLGLSALNDNN